LQDIAEQNKECNSAKTRGSQPMKENQERHNKNSDARYNNNKKIPHELVKGKTTNSLLIFIPNIKVEEKDDGSLLIRRSR
jgi:hypothetical protein